MNYRTPRHYVLLLLWVYFGVSVCVIGLSMVDWAKWLMSILLALQWWWLNRHLSRLRSITKLRVAEAACSVDIKGETYFVKEYEKPFVLSWLVILYWQFEGRRWAIPVFEKSLEVDHFREVRVALLASRTHT